MIDLLAPSISIIITIAFALKAKKYLYVHEHENSIKKELETFETNLETLKKLDLSNNYKISSEHIY
ncbi:hypothetical protein WNY78_14370 [Psychroserpens sp. AS72]|uniref:hypothetical protein n=1 Tax=Psychroserpens sp. AS72 TaxID=3135775 RepID=UPI003181FE69